MKGVVLEELEELIVIWITRLKLNNALGYFDINRVSEDVALDVLNTAYNYDLENINYKEFNSAGIDLIDHKNRVVFQVTSRSDRQKVVDSLNKFQNSKSTSKDYDHRFFILSDKKPAFRKNKRITIENLDGKKETIEFDSGKNILLISDILKKAASNNEIARRLHAIFKSRVKKKVEPANYYFFNASISEKLSSAVFSGLISLESVEKQSIPKYIRSKQSKYIKTKTILFKDELKPFYDVYFPTELIDSKEKPVHKKEDSFDSLFSRTDFVTIIGTAGSGKSTFLKHAFLSSLKNFFALPILIELRKLNNSKKSLVDLIADELFISQYDDNHLILDQFLSQGNLLFLFDGYDEIFSQNLSDRVYELENFIDKYHENKFVISSRPNTGIESFPRFHNYEVKQLDSSDVHSFIRQQVVMTKTANIIIKSLSGQLEGHNRHFFFKPPLTKSVYIEVSLQS